ncbi:hypothetical protein B0H10DRAFT_1946800 [Mycena sp. CBHHK59/15]|nr:hypothetical protein B0H10DRAFT_1946800 [Mycena sp. CBHHK59/15]
MSILATAPRTLASSRRLARPSRDNSERPAPKTPPARYLLGDLHPTNMVVGVKSETNSAGHGVAGSQVTESPARTSRRQGQRFRGKSLVIVEPPRAATAPLRDLWIPGCRSPGNLPAIVNLPLKEAAREELNRPKIRPCSLVSAAIVKPPPHVLPNGPLYGHYSHKRQLYTVYSGSSDIVRHTPTPEEAPVIDNNTINPFFHQPRYLSLNYPYLLFIPRNYPWRDNFFKIFDHPHHKLPIISDEDNGFCLHHDVAEHWLRMELCLRALGNAMFQLAPQQALYRFVNSWFFPARFKFLLSFRSERAARFAAACSRDNFLPLLGYVSIGLCMITEKTTKVHSAFLSYLEESVVVNWREEHVGALYRIPAPEGVHHKEREARRELEWLLGTILRSTVPGTIPIYLSWGNLPRQISSFDVPPAFLDFVPDTDELEYLASSPQGELIFSRWTVDSASLVWYRDPYMPPVAPAPPPTPGPDNEHRDSAAPAVEPAPFPPLPAHSKQKKNETIQAFFARRREGNLKVMAKESFTDRQRRTQRSEHAKKGQVPSKACVFVWEEQDGHYICQPGGRGNYEDLWSEYNGPGVASDADTMQVMQTQRLHDIEMESLDYGQPGDEDLGPDMAESDIPVLTSPKPRGTNGQARVRVERRKSLARTRDAVWVFDAAVSREFVPLNPPQACLKPQLLANVVGMRDIGGQLATEKGLANILGIFFGQWGCARSPKTKLFQIRRENLKSMRNPSEEAYYYVVSKIGSGIGSEALLIPRATDLIEILRQQWGPELKDVAQHLLARGIPFRLAYVSTEIMPARETPAPLSHRPKGFMVDTSSGLGFRPRTTSSTCTTITHTHPARSPTPPYSSRSHCVADGGVIGRLARFSDDIYDVGDCLWNGVTTWAYWHDRLSDHEIDLLCGVYHVRTGQKRGGGKDKGKQGHGQDESDAEQTSIVSWWPKPRCLHSATPKCLEHNLKFQKDIKKCWDGYERVASSIVDCFVDMGAILS